MNPPTHPGLQGDQSDSKIKDVGQSYIIREKNIKNPAKKPICKPCYFTTFKQIFKLTVIIIMMAEKLYLKG